VAISRRLRLEQLGQPDEPITVGGGSVLTPGATCPQTKDCYKVWICTLRPYASAKGAAVGGATYTPRSRLCSGSIHSGCRESAPEREG